MSPINNTIRFLFPKEDRASRIRRSSSLLRSLLLMLILVLSVYMPIRLIKTGVITINEVIMLGLIGVIVLAYLFYRRGHYYASAIITLSISFIALSFIAFTNGGVRDGAIMAYLVIILFSALLLGKYAAIATSVMSVASIWVMVWMENNGYIEYHPWSVDNIAVDITFYILVIAGFSVFYDNVLINYISELKESRSDYKRINIELTKKNEEITRYNRELKVAKEKAEESDRLKTAFLTNLSHEIRTPLNGIIGFSELVMGEEITKEERLSYNGIIANSGKQLLNVVNDIIDISKIESGVIDLHFQHFNLKELLTDLYHFHSVSAKAKGLNLEIIQEENTAVETLYSDRTKLLQVVNNLIANAVKFTEKGFVRFGHRSEGDKIHFFVSDSGIGISTEQQKVIFDRFSQAESGISRKYGGTGLGLSIAKAYVEKLGGNIWVDSSPQEGTTFFFTLPIESSENTREEGSAESNQRAPLRMKVLVVEDIEVNQVLLKGLLKKYNFKVICVDSGEAAVELFEQADDLSMIFMDIKLPGIDGYEAVRRIRSQNKLIPIIAQTAYAFENDRERLLSEGFDEMISKPITREALDEVIGKVHQ